MERTVAFGTGRGVWARDSCAPGVAMARTTSAVNVDPKKKYFAIRLIIIPRATRARTSATTATATRARRRRLRNRKRHQLSRAALRPAHAEDDELTAVDHV